MLSFKKHQILKKNLSARNPVKGSKDTGYRPQEKETFPLLCSDNDPVFLYVGGKGKYHIPTFHPQKKTTRFLKKDENFAYSINYLELSAIL